MLATGRKNKSNGVGREKLMFVLCNFRRNRITGKIKKKEDWGLIEKRERQDLRGKRDSVGGKEKQATSNDSRPLWQTDLRGKKPP